MAINIFAPEHFRQIYHLLIRQRICRNKRTLHIGIINVITKSVPKTIVVTVAATR
jgi:hypothetical protein